MDPPAELAWSRLLRAAACMRRELAADLNEEHGLSITAYEALHVLSRAADQGMKRVELAERLALTPSGVTRLLEGLGEAGLTERVACETDLRVSYARITDAGAERLREAACGHTRSIRTLFESHLSPQEVEVLGELLGRLPGALDETLPCEAAADPGSHPPLSSR